MKIRFNRFACAVALCSACVAALPSSLSSVMAQETSPTTAKSSSATKSLPSAEDVIKKYVAASGGQEKLQAVKSIVSKGKLSIPAAGVNGDVVLQQVSDGKFLMSMEIPGVVSQSSGSDGSTLWETSNVTGTEVLSGVRAEQTKHQMTLFPSLEMNRFFDSVECTSQEKFGGEDCYVVVAKKKGQPSMTSYFSVATGLGKGNRMTASTAMGDLKIVSEIKTHIEKGGIQFPGEVEATLPNGMKQVITMEEIEVNAKIDSKEFALPDEVKSMVKN
jgi:hypothetical protein